MKNIGITFIVFACLALSACHESAPGKVTNELSAAFLTSCSSNADCAEGLKCENGKCISSVIQDIVVPPGGCKTEGDCAEGKNCANGICVEKIKVGCVADADCGEGKSCANGICVEKIKVGCVADADCEEGKSCANGICVEKVKAECVADAECGEGKVCGEGKCIAGGVVECVEDAKCGQGKVCKEGVCVAGVGEDGGGAGNVVMECMAECKVGTVCKNGQCVPTAGPAPGAGCATSAECGPGKICKNGVCTASTIMGGLGLNFLPKKIGSIGGGTGSQETGTCMVDKDCDSYSKGTVCKNGQCVATFIKCTSSANCVKGEVCDVNSGMCIGINKEIETYECEIDGVKGPINAKGECSAEVKQSPIVTSIGLKIKTADYDGAGTDAIFALKFCKGKNCTNGDSKIYIGGKNNCGSYTPCAVASLEKGDLNTLFVDLMVWGSSKFPNGEIITIKDLEDLDHFEIDVMQELGDSWEWGIKGISIHALYTDKNNKQINKVLYNNPWANAGVTLESNAKFSLKKSDVVVVADITTSCANNAGTDDNIFIAIKGSEIALQKPKAFLLDDDGDDFEKCANKKYGMTYYALSPYDGYPYAHAIDLASITPQFRIFKGGDDGWAISKFTVYIFNPAYNNNDQTKEQHWSFTYAGKKDNKICKENICYDNNDVLWLDSDTGDTLETLWIAPDVSSYTWTVQ